MALALTATPAFAAPCNEVNGCVIRAEFCTISTPVKCHIEHLLPEQGVGLCTMLMAQAATTWITGDRLAHITAHPNFRFTSLQCVTPDDTDL